MRRIQRLSQEPLSLETPVGSEENSYLGDFIEDDSLPGPVDSASRRLLKEQMEEILDGLSERERKVLVMRFGLEDGVTRTLEDVGQRVQRHARARPADRGQGIAQAAPSVAQPQAP